jgi:hypothetical protein
MMDLPVTVGIPFEHTMEKFQFSWQTLLVVKIALAWCPRMLTGWVVVQLSIQIHIGVGGLTAHSVPQGPIWSSIYVNVHGELDVTEVVQEIIQII